MTRPSFHFLVGCLFPQVVVVAVIAVIEIVVAVITASRITPPKSLGALMTATMLLAS